MGAEEEGWSERGFDLGRVRLHAIEAGPTDGPLVLLLHGFPEFSYGWRHQIGALAAAGYRVVAPDLRGYGRSEKPRGLDAYRLHELGADVLSLADALGRDTFRLVGHDWGGIVAWWVAARQSGRVDRLAILNAPHPDTVGPFIRRNPGQLGRSFYVGLFQIPRLPERLLSAFGHFALRRALTGSSRRGTFSASELDRYAEAWSRKGALTGMLNWYRALIRRPAKPIGRIPVPTLVLWGMRDAALAPGLADAAVALCDQAGILPFEDATHWLQHEEPEAVNAALLSFLAA